VKRSILIGKRGGGFGAGVANRVSVIIPERDADTQAFACDYIGKVARVLYWAFMRMS
jgi:hypothetical protein